MLKETLRAHTAGTAKEKQIFIFGHDVGKQRLTDLEIVASLLECDAENLLCLHRRGNIGPIDLYDIIAAFSLGFEDFQRLGRIAGRDACPPQREESPSTGPPLSQGLHWQKGKTARVQSP